jgi:hypothetical protein
MNVEMYEFGHLFDNTLKSEDKQVGYPNTENKGFYNKYYQK